jgi:predicted transcriptional regulator
MVLTQKNLDDILEHMKNSMNNLAKESFENLEIEGDIKKIENFLENQFDIRLENLLATKNSSIHHLESGIKNLIIQRKQKMFEEIFNQYKN